MDHLRPSTNSDKLSEGLCQLSGVPESGGEGTRLLHWGAAGRPTACRWRLEDRAPQGHPGSARAPGEEREHLLLTEAVALHVSACVVGCSWPICVRVAEIRHPSFHAMRAAPGRREAAFQPVLTRDSRRALERRGSGSRHSRACQLQPSIRCARSLPLSPRMRTREAHDLLLFTGEHRMLLYQPPVTPTSIPIVNVRPSF